MAALGTDQPLDILSKHDLQHLQASSNSQREQALAGGTGQLGERDRDPFGQDQLGSDGQGRMRILRHVAVPFWSSFLADARHLPHGRHQAGTATSSSTNSGTTSPPGQVVLDDHGEPYRPQLGAARVVASTGEGGEPHRHIAVRIAYTDDRAEAFLRSEARQLPKNAPGLIMIDTGDAVGALKRWEPVLVGRFRPAQHTRVSAVVLFRSGLLAEDPPRLHVEAKLVRNEFAKHQLSTWIADQIANAS